MQPGEYYQLGIVLTALFVAPFSGLARVVVASWLVARLMWCAGAPEPVANIAGHCAILMFGFRRLSGGLSTGAWMMSAFIAVFSTMWVTGWLAPATCWWLVLILAFAQLAFLGLSMDHETVRQVLAVWQEAATREYMKIRHALFGRTLHG